MPYNQNNDGADVFFMIQPIKIVIIYHDFESSVKKEMSTIFSYSVVGNLLDRS